MARATGTFTVKSWEENSYAELDSPVKLTEASVAFGYDGDLDGSSSARTLMFYKADGTAEYTGLELITGRLAGRAGSFVVRGTGGYGSNVATTQWQIVDGSGTGELSGLRGSGTAVADQPTGGHFTLDYELG